MNDIKAVFAHDHVFYTNDKGLIFSGGGLPAKIWDRYLNHFCKITVIGRQPIIKSNPIDFASLALSSAQNVTFSLLPNISGISNFIRNSNEVKQAICTIVKNHDAVIARLSSEFGFIAIKEAIKQKKPWAVELVGCPSDALKAYGGIKANLYAPILRHRTKNTLRKSKHSIYVTKNFLQERYPSLGNNVIACSNVEIHTPQIATLTKRLESQSLLKKKYVLGLIGSLNSKLKGLDVSIRAIADILKTGIDCELRILGGGDKTHWVSLSKKLGIGDKVFFEGTLPSGVQVFEWLDKIDIYIQPSYSEGLPRSLIEAMSRGCPAIASKVGGIPELLDVDFLVLPGEVGELTEKIVQLIMNVELQKRQATRNFEVSKSYTRDNLGKLRCNFWDEFIRQNFEQID